MYAISFLFGEMFEMNLMFLITGNCCLLFGFTAPKYTFFSYISIT